MFMHRFAAYWSHDHALNGCSPEILLLGHSMVSVSLFVAVTIKLLLVTITLLLVLIPF